MKYGMRATLGQSARRTLCTRVQMRVFHNTAGETSLMRAQMGHYLYKNDLRLPKARKPAIGNKWTHGVAQTAEYGRMGPDPSGRKPSRFTNRTPRVGPGPSH